MLYLCQMLDCNRACNGRFANLAKWFNRGGLVRRKMCQNNQIDLGGRAMKKMLEVLYYQTNIHCRTWVHDDNSLLVNQVCVCHRKTVSDRMYPAWLLGKRRQLLLALNGNVQSYSPEQ